MRILSARTPRAVIAVARPLAELDRSSRVPSVQGIDGAVSHAESSDETIEGRLAAWWREMLGVEQVGLDEDFFNLGGHSLVGVRLMAKIKKAYQVDLDFGAIFEARTVRLLADVILKAKLASDEKQGRHS
jgi:acyl carrier protein